MSEAKQNKPATAKLIAEYPHCCFCGGLRQATTREHMPPKALFDKSHRPDKLVMPSCKECNAGTKKSDLIVSIISRWDFEDNIKNTAILEDSKKLINGARREYPEIIDEWIPNDAFRLKGIQHLKKNKIHVPDGSAIARIGSLTNRQLNLFSHKVVLALYFETFKKSLPNTGGTSALWRTKEDFVVNGIPQILLDKFPRYGTLAQGKWNTQEIFEYRFSKNTKDGIFGCLSKFRNSFFVVGFAIEDISILPTNDVNWLSPINLLDTVEFPSFTKTS